MEKIIGSLARVSGHTYDIIYRLYFTKERIIAVIIQHPMDISIQFPSIWRTAFLGSGSARRREQIEREKIAQERCNSLQYLTPDDLFATHPKNFNMYYKTIESIEIKRQLFQGRLRFRVCDESGIKRIINFTLPKKQVPEARQLLESVLLSKIKAES